MVLHSAPRGRDDRTDCPGGAHRAGPGKRGSDPRVLARGHRNRRGAALGDHQLLHNQVLARALQGSSRAREEGASVTELIRSDAARRSSVAALAIGGLIVGILWFRILTVVVALQDLSGSSDAQTDSYMALVIGVGFLLLAAVVDIYRR